MPGTCGSCGAEGVALQCARCKNAYYCNSECQKAAWKAHKGTCLEPAKVYDVKCSGCGGWGEGLVGESGKCAHCTSASA